MNGVITVTTAGTRVQGDDAPGSVFALKADPANTGIVYVGKSDVAAANGFPLEVGEGVALRVGNLNKLWFDASASQDNFMAEGYSLNASYTF